MRKNQPHRKQQRQEAAEERQATRDARTPEEQLEVLKDRGITAGQEVTRLKKEVGS